jgi:hypothetical protein
MGAAAAERVRCRRQRKHPFRLFLLILLGTLAAIGGFFLMSNPNPRNSPPSANPAISGDDNTSVQFK